LYLVEQLYDAIITVGSHHSIALDLSGNAVPDGATMAMLYAINGFGGWTQIEEPGTVTGTAAGADVAAQEYEYTKTSSAWIGAIDGAELLNYEGTWYVNKGALWWEAPAEQEGVAGVYTLAEHDDITVTVT